MAAQRFRIPLIAAGMTLLIHLIGNAHYGYFRDELYFIICGRHPAFGYADQPPLTPLTAGLTQIFGHSLFLLRLLPALFAAAAVYIVCFLVEELDGGAFAQILAAIATALSPVLLAFGAKVGPDMYELWLWPLAAWWTLRIVKGADQRWWLAVGATIGIAFQSKYIVVFFAAAVIVGLLLTPQRRVLFDKWFAAGIGLALLIMLPNILWQAFNHWPMWTLLRHGQEGKKVVLSPIDFMLEQLLILNPILSILWLIGVVWLFFKAQTRWLAYGYLILMLAMILLHAKNYYPAAIYSILFGAGAAAVEGWTARAAVARTAITLVALIAGAWLAPFALPILPTQSYIAYATAVSRSLHLSNPQSEHHKQGRLPQGYADMHGWPELADAVGAIYKGLPVNQRAKTSIFASNYGEASAIDFFGGRFGLPPVLSAHNQYYLWGPRGQSGDVLIDVNGDLSTDRKVFKSVRRVAIFSNPYGMPYEDGIPIYLCSGIKTPLTVLWAKIPPDYN